MNVSHISLPCAPCDINTSLPIDQKHHHQVLDEEGFRATISAEDKFKMLFPLKDFKVNI